MEQELRVRLRQERLAVALDENVRFPEHEVEGYTDVRGC